MPEAVRNGVRRPAVVHGSQDLLKIFLSQSVGLPTTAMDPAQQGVQSIRLLRKHCSLRLVRGRSLRSLTRQVLGLQQRKVPDRTCPVCRVQPSTGYCGCAAQRVFRVLCQGSWTQGRWPLRVRDFAAAAAAAAAEAAEASMDPPGLGLIVQRPTGSWSGTGSRSRIGTGAGTRALAGPSCWLAASGRPGCHIERRRLHLWYFSTDKPKKSPAGSFTLPCASSTQRGACASVESSHLTAYYLLCHDDGDDIRRR
ncbi:hypothetical protein IWX47DRAFT_356553 [Phyllosticta citricarpa]